MTNYKVTIGYKSVINFDIKADNEKEAKEMAIEMMTKARDKMLRSKGVMLQDDSFSAHGILNMDETWNMLSNF